MSSPAKKVVKSEDHLELEGVALTIYSALLSRDPRCVDDVHLAQKAFKAANRFVMASAGCADGSLDCTPPKPAEPVWVDVDLMVQKQDEKWSYALDRNGRRVTTKMLQDPDSFAPNLPLDHPINQRSSQRGKEAWAEAQAEKVRAEQEKIAATTRVG